MVIGPELTVFAQHVKHRVDGGHADPSLVKVLDSVTRNSLLWVILTLSVMSCNVERLFSTVTERN